MIKILRLKFRLANFIICLQLTLSPIAFADPIPVQDGGGGLSGIAAGAQTFAAFMNQAVGAYTNANGGGNPQNYQQFKQQLTPLIALKPEQPGAGKFPAIFNGCVVLEAKGNRLSKGAMCSGNGVSPQDLLAGYPQAIIDIADENIQKLDNFSTPSSDRTEIRGLTCYNEAIANLAGQLEQREAQLETYSQRLTTLIDNFEGQSKQTVEAIKQNDAILNGPCKGCKNKDGTNLKNYLEDFKFDNLLMGGADRTICGSWFTRTDIAAKGQANGLRGIETTVRAQLGVAETFNDQKKQITAEINSLATLLSNGFQRRDGFTVDASSVNTRTNYLSAGSGALKTSIDNFNSRMSEEIASISDGLDLGSMIGQENQEASIIQRQILANSIDHSRVESELVDLERKYFKSCVERIITSNDNWSSVSSLATSFKNPNVRGRLGDEADNAMASSIISYVNNLDEMDIDEFIKKIKVVESEGLNRTKIIVLDKSFPELGINASTPLPPSRLFTVFADNCKKRFTSEKTSSGFTQAKVISSLRDYSQKLTRLKRNSATTLLADIKKDLLTCPGSTAGTSAASCSDSDLAPSSPKFCVKAASKCSSNVFACNSKVASKINEVKVQQDNLVSNYNKQVTDVKKQLVSEVAALQNFMVTESNRLNALLNVGTLTELPALAMVFSGKDFSRKDVRPELAMQDPAKYLELASEQVANLKDEMIKQREELVGDKGTDSSIGLNGKGRLGNFASQYVDRFSTEKAYYESLIADCEGAYQKALAQKQDQDKAIADQNREVAEACDAIQAFNANPMEGDPAEVASAAADAVRIAASMPNQGPPVNGQQDMETINRLRQFNQECADSEAGYGSGNLSADQICRYIANPDDGQPDSIEQRVEEFYSGNTGVISLCDQLNGETPSQSQYSELDPCGRGQKITAEKTICRISASQSTVYKKTMVDDQERYIPQSGISIIITDDQFCESHEYYKSEPAEGETPEKVGFGVVSSENIQPDEFEKLFLSPEYSPNLDCVPAVALESQDDRGTRRDDRRARERLEDEVNNMAAAFNCTQSRRRAGVGQAGLSICGAGDNSGVNNKGISPQLMRDLATAAGQAGAALSN